ncbi:MAG: hypothetical protein QXX17_00440 [Conexivisphaerales archaeon]
MEEPVFKQLERKRKRETDIASAILLVASALLFFLSYYLSNVIIAIDSIVAFAAGLVLLLRRPEITVQTRVLDSIVGSYHDSLKRVLHIVGMTNDKFAYISMGKNVEDVKVVPLRKLDIYKEELRIIPDKGSAIPPPGSGLAELIVREGGLAVADLQATVDALPSIFVGDLKLAEGLEVAANGEVLEAKVHNPIIFSDCKDDSETIGRFGCDICSSLAVIFTHATKKPALISKCKYDRGSRSCSILVASAIEEES